MEGLGSLDKHFILRHARATFAGSPSKKTLLFSHLECSVDDITFLHIFKVLSEILV